MLLLLTYFNVTHYFTLFHFAIHLLTTTPNYALI